MRDAKAGGAELRVEEHGVFGERPCRLRNAPGRRLQGARALVQGGGGSWEQGDIPREESMV